LINVISAEQLSHINLGGFVDWRCKATYNAMNIEDVIVAGEAEHTMRPI